MLFSAKRKRQLVHCPGQSASSDRSAGTALPCRTPDCTLAGASNTASLGVRFYRVVSRASDPA